MEGEVIFNKITKKLIYTTRRYKNLSDDQFRFARASNTFKMFSRMLCNGASNGESLISIYKVFFGSYSRYKVSNDVMPHVLDPTNLYLKLWVNILTIGMLLCSLG